jgi:GT2 family glycosyltransferase
MIVDKEKFNTLNGFDDIHFSPFYYEDLDLSYRAWQHHWECHYTTHTHVIHQHQTTIKKHYKKKAIKKIAKTHALLFTWKNCKSIPFLISHIITLLIKCLTFQINDTQAMLNALYYVPSLIKYKKNNPKHLRPDKEILTPFKQQSKEIQKKQKY